MRLPPKGKIVPFPEKKVMPANIIALLTDFGYPDPFVGMMKGVILGINPAVRLVDLTHQIEAGDIEGAAFILKHSLPFFPPGTIFLAVVDPGVGSARNPLLIESGGKYFIGPDNGLFYPALAPGAFKAYKLDSPQYHLKKISSTFHGRDLFAPAAAHLSLGVPPSELGGPVKEIVRLELPQAKPEGDFIRCEVVQVDRFGNLITNLEAGAVQNRQIKEIEIKDRVIRELCTHYAEKPAGELLAVWDGFSRLEIAVNRGNAAQLLGAGKKTRVVVKLEAES